MFMLRSKSSTDYRKGFDFEAAIREAEEARVRDASSAEASPTAADAAAGEERPPSYQEQSRKLGRP